VNWALRQIGKRDTEACLAAARDLAGDLTTRCAADKANLLESRIPYPAF